MLYVRSVARDSSWVTFVCPDGGTALGQAMAFLQVQFPESGTHAVAALMRGGEVVDTDNVLKEVPNGDTAPGRVKLGDDVDRWSGQGLQVLKATAIEEYVVSVDMITSAPLLVRQEGHWYFAVEPPQGSASWRGLHAAAKLAFGL